MKAAWQVAVHDEAEVQALCDACAIDKIPASILYGRGVRTPEAMAAFLNPCLSDLHSPFLLDGMHEAVARIKEAVRSGERIAIFSDSDIDGITSLAIIHDLLAKLKSAAYIRYPRDREGYGLTYGIIDEFKSEGITLVITVDCGIRDFAEIGYAKSCGMDFIVTDHHEPDSSLPDAIILNPKLGDSPYPFKELAGVGVAFKLAHAFKWSERPSYNVRFVVVTPSEGGIRYSFIRNWIITGNGAVESSQLEWFASSVVVSSDRVVLAGDCAELRVFLSGRSDISFEDLFVLANKTLNKNYKSNDSCMDELPGIFMLRKNLRGRNHETAARILVELQMRGLEKLHGSLREYMALVAVGTIADIMPALGENRPLIMFGMDVFNGGNGHQGIREILGVNRASSKSISWDVAPLLNTPGRMGETRLTVDFFLKDDRESTMELLAEIRKLNSERKKLVTDTINRIRAKNPDAGIEPGFFYYADDSIKDGLAGLVANRIAEEIKKPVIIMSGPDGNGHIKGSGRSFGKYNFLRHLEPLSSMFERLGGHAQAFGFTIRKENIGPVMQQIAGSIGNSCVRDDNIRIDAVLDQGMIDSAFIERLSLLEPYGKENEEPLFLSRNVEVSSFQRFGADSNHGKYILGTNIQAIGWNIADMMQEYSNSGKELDMVYRLDNNRYLNRLYPRMLIMDIDYSH
ncbi:MAG TPA: single-stranded-DNA-specific exonuclease RecJ [Spirochaetota bacterium]|nr:single-stranded-DNA-specific exonuclease RecJ [Spirochaetota bacterium]